MTIATQNDLINARANKRQTFGFQKNSIASQAAGTLCSLYRSTGPIPAQPAIPGTFALCTKALTWNFNNPGGADKTYLDVMDGCSSVAGRLVWFDRLGHSGGLSGTVTTAQAVNSQSVLTFPFRGSASEEAEWFLEWYTATGATLSTATVAVTHTDLTTANIAIALAATRPVGFLAPIVSPGKIIASVQSVTLSASTGTAGNFGVTCMDRKSGWSIHIPTSNQPPPGREGILSEVANDSCLCQVVELSGTSTGDWRGEFTLIQG